MIPLPRPITGDGGHRSNGLNFFTRLAGLVVAAVVLAAGAGCTATSALVTVVGISTDTSVTWEVVKYMHGQLTEGDDRPCALLNSAQRAVAARCAPFRPGSIAAADIGHTGLAECELTLAARDPLLWPALGELMDKGARLEACTESPIVALAQRQPCPAFDAAPEASRQSLERIALAD